MFRLIRLNNQIKISLFTAVLLIFIVVASMAGITYAWYFAGANTLSAAQFTAGTVKVDLDQGYSGDNPDITDQNGCKLYTWHLKNMGTKSSYVRIRVDSDKVDGTGDTAWAYLDEDNAFRNNQVEGNPSNAWGWTNKITEDILDEDGSVDLTLYAGAGNNILENGTEVGKVTVEYSTSTISVEYIINSDSNYRIDEAHLWIGNEKLPANEDKPDKPPTAAPGQFPYKYNKNEPDRIEIDDDRTFASFNLDDHDLSLPFYVAAHAKDEGKEESVQPVKIDPESDCADNWFTFGKEEDGYYYYYYGNPDTEKVQKLEAEQEFTFCLLVCLPDKEKYDFEIQIEAVQSTNNAIEAVGGWPQEVW